MVRALRLAIVGWACGFLVVAAVGIIRGTQHGTTSLLIPALVALGVTSVLLAAAGAHDLLERRRERAWWRAIERRAARQAVQEEARAVIAAADETAARIAALEARLALEIKQLDAAAAVLAEAELMPSPRPPELTLVGDAVADEPVLRAQLVETFAAMVEHSDDIHAMALGDLETLLDKAG